MKNIVKVLFAAVLMLAAAIAISAGDVVFQDGGLTLSQDLLVETDALFVDSTTGEVGIGTSSPAKELHVIGTTFIDNSGSTHGLSGNPGLVVDGALGEDIARFRDVGANTKVTIDSAGNVGIGITPVTKLDVAGQIHATGDVCTDAGGGTCLSTAGGIPSGAVMFFNLGSCPSGWTELTAAQGRYLVGLPPSGSLALTAGTALSDLEDRAVGQHSHAVTDPGHTHTYTETFSFTSDDGADGLPTGATSTRTSATSSTGTGISINNAGSVAGTPAPYLQLLTCQKD